MPESQYRVRFEHYGKSCWTGTFESREDAREWALETAKVGLHEIEGV